MATHSPFETLARVIEHLDDDGRSVRRTEAAGSGEDGSLRATVDVSVGAPSGGDAGLEPTDAAVDDGLSVTFRAPTFPNPGAALPAEHPRVSAAPTDVWLDAGSVVVTLEVTIGDAARQSDEADAAGDNGPAGAAGRDGLGTARFGGRPAGDETGSETDAANAGVESPLAAVRDESLPAYDDTPYLRRLYETCGTFAEMSERIDMDVSAETVRRYMIEADVHSPTSYETAGGSQHPPSGGAADTPGGSDTGPTGTGSATTPGTAEEPDEAVGREGTAPDGDSEAAAPLPDEQLVADGIGLPEELTLHDVVDAVVDARTVHEVQREVGLGYDRTRQLLTQLNVLDLVVGRVSGDSDRIVTVDVVADRIRQCAPDAA